MTLFFKIFFACLCVWLLIANDGVELSSHYPLMISLLFFFLSHSLVVCVLADLLFWCFNSSTSFVCSSSVFILPPKGFSTLSTVADLTGSKKLKAISEDNPDDGGILGQNIKKLEKRLSIKQDILEKEVCRFHC